MRNRNFLTIKCLGEVPHSLDIPISNLSPKTGYPEFVSFYSAPPCKCYYNNLEYARTVSFNVLTNSFKIILKFSII